MTQPILNLADVQPQPRPPEFMPSGAAAQRIEMRLGRIASVLGLTHLGCSLVVVPPGKQAFPFHSHRHNDELFVVLQGQGELRHGGQRHPLREGDVVGCPAGGPETAHAITNTGTTDLRYLALSSEHTPEICDYPDSGKFGVFDASPAAAAQPGGSFHHFGRADQPVDYWDGE